MIDFTFHASRFTVSSGTISGGANMDQSLALFVVLVVNLVIWAAIAVYLWRLDAKVKELEKR